MSATRRNVEQILREAAAAVVAAGLPAELQETAFAKAIDLIASAPPVQLAREARKHRTSTESDIQSEEVNRDEAAMFAELARESGVEERDLRDILQLTSTGQLHVTPPTKDLGSSVAEQAKNVIALVAGARSKGLGERVVDANGVRAELQRKHCYDRNNFAGKHLGPMRGFNAGSNRNEIVLTSRWVDEFTSAVAKAHGRASREG